MKKKRRVIIAFALCVLLAFLCSFSAFADGGYETPTIPIHTKHTYYILSQTDANCTESGLITYKCRGCTRTYTQEVEPLGHLYCLTDYSSEGAHLICSICDSGTTVSADVLESYWRNYYINTEPKRTGTDASGYLDLNGDGIINAKDYGAIMNAVYYEQ